MHRSWRGRGSEVKRGAMWGQKGDIFSSAASTRRNFATRVFPKIYAGPWRRLTTPLTFHGLLSLRRRVPPATLHELSSDNCRVFLAAQRCTRNSKGEPDYDNDDDDVGRTFPADRDVAAPAQCSASRIDVPLRQGISANKGANEFMTKQLCLHDSIL